MERDERAALENERSEFRSADDFRQSLCAEIDTIVCSREMLLHGPDTVECFDRFQ